MFFKWTRNCVFLLQSIDRVLRGEYELQKTKTTLYPEIVIFSNYNTSIRQLLFKVQLDKTVSYESKWSSLTNKNATLLVSGDWAAFHPNTAWFKTQVKKKIIFLFRITFFFAILTQQKAKLGVWKKPILNYMHILYWLRLVVKCNTKFDVKFILSCKYR